MESVTRTPKGKSEISSDSDARKQLNTAIGMVVSCGNNPTADSSTFREAVERVLNFLERIDTTLPAGKIKLTGWEADLLKIIATKFIDAGSIPVTLGSISKASDDEYSMNFSATSITLNLLERRGLVKNLSHKEIEALIIAANPEREIPKSHADPDEQAGFIILTEKGKLYYSQNWM